MTMHTRTRRVLGSAKPLELKDATGTGEADLSGLPPEIKSAVKEVMTALGAIREKVEQNERETKRIGGEIKDVVSAESLKKIEKAVDELKANVNAELAKLRRPPYALDAADRKAARIVAEFKMMAALAGVRLDDDAAALTALGEYKAAIPHYLRKGPNALSPDEAKTLRVGVAPEGGYLVFTERSDRVVERIFETSALRAHATVITVGTNRVTLPVDWDEAGIETVTEESPRSETSTPKIGEIDIDVHEMSAMPSLTQNMIDDPSIDIEAWLDRKVADKFARTENKWFITGNGVKEAFGILSLPTATTADATRAFGTVQYVASGKADGFAASNPADQLLDLIYELKAAFRQRARFLAARRTLGSMRKFKDGQGQYIAGARLQDNALIETIFGFPVTEAEDMPAIAADAFPLAFGDWSEAYTIVERQGLRQLRDPYTTKGKVKVYTTRRIGGRPTNTEAYKLLKIAAS